MAGDDAVRLWGGRFAGSPDAAFQALNNSLPVDRRMWRHDIAGSRAHARMLTTGGIIPEADGQAIAAGLDAIEAEMAAGAFAFVESDEDIHTAVERRLTELAGDAGRRLHTGRSRNDQVATDVLLYLAEAAEAHAAAVGELATVMLDAADAHVETLLPGYTHLQRAQPVRLAHHLGAYVWMLVRDRDRLRAARTAALAHCPLGSGALSGVGFPIDRDATARELGFAAAGPNSLDGVAGRDALADYLHAAATLGVHLSRLGEELVVWSSDEFGFVHLSDAFTSGSSMLPQKKNPDAAELARAKVSRLVADYAGLQGVVAGLPLAYNKDLQEDKHFLFDAIDTLDLLLPAVTGMLREARFDADAMSAAAEGGFLAATDLADHLVRLGWPFRRAHEAVGALVRACVDAGHGLDASTSAQREAAGLAGVDLPPLTAAAGVEAKLSAGGTGRRHVVAQLAAARAALGS